MRATDCYKAGKLINKNGKCPECKKFGLELDPGTIGRLSCYRCRFCGAEFELLHIHDDLPPQKPDMTDWDNAPAIDLIYKTFNKNLDRGIRR